MNDGRGADYRDERIPGSAMARRLAPNLPPVRPRVYVPDEPHCGPRESEAAIHQGALLGNDGLDGGFLASSYRDSARNGHRTGIGDCDGCLLPPARSSLWSNCLSPAQ